MFSKEWETRYAEGKSHSSWPWTELITYVSKYGEYPKSPRVLELGPGVGANIPFFVSLGAEYYAIEGSKTGVSTIIDNFPLLKDNIKQGDFTQAIPFEGYFDLIIDRSSVTHNDTRSILRCLKMVRQKLAPSGKYIGIDWFSWNHSERLRGTMQEDIHTFVFRDGKFASCGNVHFSTKLHMLELFEDAGLEIMILDHKSIQTHKQDAIGDSQGTWNIVARGKL